MIFTVGNRKIYREQYERQGDQFAKLGRDGGYPGGIVFETAADASRFLKTPADFARVLPGRDAADFEVWAVKADWSFHTVPSDHGWWHALTETAPLIPLERVSMCGRCILDFKGAACGYRGNVDKCDKTFEACQLRDNAPRFGGFPAIPVCP